MTFDIMSKAQPHPIGKLRRLDPSQRKLLVRAMLTLAAASAAVAFLPFRKAVRFGSVPLGEGRIAVDDCVWAIEAAARRLPWRAVCIEQGLAAQRMLRRRGVDARLHYGACHEGHSRDLRAHVWVSVAGQIVLGEDDARGHAEIATYP